MHTKESDEEFRIGLVNMEVYLNCPYLFAALICGPYLWPAICDPKRKRRRRGRGEHRLGAEAEQTNWVRSF